MKPTLTLVALFTSSLVQAASEALTIKSTTISSYCPPYANSTVPAAAITSTASRAPVVSSYEYETEYESNYVEETLTECDSFGGCHVTTHLERETTVTTSVNGILTVYTTLVPVETGTQEWDDSQEEETELYNTTLTLTTCSEGQCSLTAVVTGVSVYTSDLTVYTTFIPVHTEIVTASTGAVAAGAVSATSSSTATTATSAPSSSAVGESPLESSTVTAYATTVLTVVSCNDDACNSQIITTGLGIVSDVHTVYTTYCPLTDLPSSSVTKAAAPATSATPAPAPTTTTITTITTAPTPASTKPKTVNVFTNNIVTETPTTAATTQAPKIVSSSSSAPSLAIQGQESTSDAGDGIYGVQTYDGAGSPAAVSSMFGVLISVLLCLA
ncbi:uncharacterized protein LODBEIA_P51190 [Lodderomyces beijingensis]|uniref:Uncharacterized protein n=1 Tax=Lodderomyces beijingensis TaxID=1775926 RepID=A0ABP0ZUL2_9ASCO